MLVQAQTAQVATHHKISVETPETQARLSKSLSDTQSKKMRQKHVGRVGDGNTGRMYLSCQVFKLPN